MDGPKEYDRLCANCGRRYGLHYGVSAFCTSPVDGRLFRESLEMSPAPPPLKKREPQFESEFVMFENDGSLMVNVAHFNAEEAWKATKLASGDIS